MAIRPRFKGINATAPVNAFALTPDAHSAGDIME